MRPTVGWYALTRVLLVGVVMAIALPAAAAQRDVSVVDSAFDPVTLEVESGDTVRWTHEGSAPHSVTRHDDGRGEAFDSHPDCTTFPLCMQGGDTFEHTFSAPGTYTYYCKIHGSSDTPCQGMCGTVVVKAASSPTSQPTQAPQTQAPTAPPPTPTQQARDDSSPSPSPTLSPTPVVETPAAAPGSDGGPSVTELPIALPERADDEPTGGSGAVAGLAVALVVLAAGAGGFAWWRLR